MPLDMQEMNGRLVRVVDFVAEELEKEAHRLPVSCKGDAAWLRNAAERLRRSNNPKCVWVREEIPAFSTGETASG